MLVRMIGILKIEKISKKNIMITMMMNFARSLIMNLV
jgi:hypothetical protein